MATDDGMVESDEYQDWLDVYGEEEPRNTGGSKRHIHIAQPLVVTEEGEDG